MKQEAKHRHPGRAGKQNGLHTSLALPNSHPAFLKVQVSKESFSFYQEETHLHRLPWVPQSHLGFSFVCSCISNHTGQTCLTTHVCCSWAHPLLLICPISLLQGKTQACFFWSCDPIIVICSQQSDKHRFPESKSGARKLQAKHQYVLKLLQRLSRKLLKKINKKIKYFSLVVEKHKTCTFPIPPWFLYIISRQFLLFKGRCWDCTHI